MQSWHVAQTGAKLQSCIVGDVGNLSKTATYITHNATHQLSDINSGILSDHTQPLPEPAVYFSHTQRYSSRPVNTPQLVRVIC